MKSEQNYDDNNDDGRINSISSCQKLKLLFWKNWILQWNQKLQFFIALILPILFLMLIVLLRLLVYPMSKEETRYPSLGISDLLLYQSSVLHGNRILHENGTLNIPKHVICYTPNNKVTSAIIKAATIRLRLLGYRPFESPEHMELNMVEHNFLVGVQFNSDTNASLNKNGFPVVLNFTLRFPSELRTMRGPIIETWQTNALFPRYDLSGPRHGNASDGGVPTGYLMEGFLPLQHAVTMSWLELGAGLKATELPDVQLQRFPYIPYTYDPLLSGLQQLLPFILLISFIYPCTYVAKYITSEKELQLKEVMKLMGIHNWLHWTAWFVKSYLMLMMVVVLLMCLLLIKFNGSVAVITHSNWFPLLIFFQFYVTTSICFCFMIAVFFSRASTAAAVTGILWFLTYIPYSFAFYYYERISLGVKLLLCMLFSNSALGFGFHVIISLEGNGAGVQLSNLLQPVSEDDNLTLFYVIIMIFLGGILYMIICLYVEQIFPGAYGASRHWYYPFSLKFWREMFRKGNAYNTLAKLSIRGQNIDSTCNRRRKVGIELCDLHKNYGQHTAVKNLNLKLYRNEITVLLGHNGAGKTTTLHMLTGIIPPTRGTALINGWNIRTQLESARRSMGICPQHNVLFNGMSVRNHIVFFSCLKGVRGSLAIGQEVDKYMRIMELEDKSSVTADKLSGGMKRKLSLCCALCGNTRAVLCDEPSSGIDPAGNSMPFSTQKDQIWNSVIRMVENTKLTNNQQQGNSEDYSILETKSSEANYCRRCLKHWQALFYKNALITGQNIWILIIQLGLPVLFTILTILNSRGGRIYYALPQMEVSLNQYETGYVVLEDRTRLPDSPLATAYSRRVASYGEDYHFVNTSDLSFEDFILKAAQRNRQRIDFKYLAGLTIDEDLLTIWLNNKPLHTAPLTLNLLHNALAQQYLGKEAEVGVNNGPLPYSKDTLTMRLNKGQRLGAEIALNISLCMSFVTAFFVLPVIKERASRAKLLQYLTGVDACSYWLSQWLWDYFIFTLTAVLSIITIAAFQEIGYSTFEDLSRYLVILLVFGMSALPLSYVMSGCFSDGATGFTRVAIITTLTGTGLFSLELALSFEPFQLMHIADQLNWYFRIFPHFCLASGLHRIHIGFNIRRGCSAGPVQKLSKSIICKNVPICCNIPSYFAWQKPGVMPEIVYLLATGLSLMSFLIVIDSKILTTLKSFSKRNRSESLRSEGGMEQQPPGKDGIEMERHIVESMSSEERSKLPLVVDSISKRYGKLLAVNKLSFYVAHAECFGLLGNNGAGKTSTFKMLTGDASITSGTAFVQGLNLRRHMRKVLPKIGYCPQFNALFDELTGRQTMHIYCLLRCIDRRYIKAICRDLAKFFGFQQHIDKKVKHYSGGNKRKLSVAIAFIGSPLVLYLDEPTCGMDPTAQRQLWQVLSQIRNLGKSTVLTTHSMEECEALCTRISIMINGELRCIGSIQQIKNNYSDGQILKIKIKASRKKNLERRIISSASASEMPVSINKSLPSIEQSSTKNEDMHDKSTSTRSKHDGKNDRSEEHWDVDKGHRKINRIEYVKNFIADKIPGAILKEEYNELLTYHLPVKSIVWSDIFQLMESNRNKLHIEDYVITQTRLEEIFLNFVWNK